MQQVGNLFPSWKDFVFALRKKFYPLGYKEKFVIEWKNIKLRKENDSRIHRCIIDQVEVHILRGCHLRTCGHTATISTFSALRTMIHLKGDGMLGSDPNPP